MSDVIRSISWRGTIPSNTFNIGLSLEPGGNLLDIDHFALRPIRLELYQEFVGMDPGQALRLTPLFLNGNSDAMLELFLRVDQTISGSKSAFGAFPLLGNFLRADMDISLSPFPSVRLFRLDLVGPTVKLVTLPNGTVVLPSSVLDQQLYLEPFRPNWPSRWAALWMSWVFNYISLPAIELATGIVLYREDWRFLSRVMLKVAPSVTSLYTANQVTVQTVIAFMKTIIAELAKDPEAKEWALKKFLRGTAESFFKKLIAFWSTLDALVLSVNFYAAISAVTDTEPLYQALISSSTEHVLITPYPRLLARKATQDVGLNLLLDWQLAATYSGQPGNQTMDTRTSRIDARARLSGTDFKTIYLQDIMVTLANGSTVSPNLELALGPAEGSELLLEPSAWNPNLGSYPAPVSFINGLNPLFRAKQSGNGDLTIYAINWEQHIALGSPPSGPPVTRLDVPLEILPADPTIETDALAEVVAGKKTGHPFRVAYPEPSYRRTAFDAGDMFYAQPVLLNDGAVLELHEPRVLRVNHWTNEDEFVPLDFDIRLERVSETGSDPPIFRFVLPEQSFESQGQSFFINLTAYIKGLRVGEAETRITIANIRRPQTFIPPHSPPQFSVQVKARQLDVEVQPINDIYEDGTLVFEDEWIERYERLISSFQILVSDDEGTLFDSLQPAYFSGVISPGTLTINDIYVEDADGFLVPLPFGIYMSLSDTSVVQFEMIQESGSVAAGSFDTWSSLWDVIHAVGPGQANLAVELIQSNSSDLDGDLIEVSLPAVIDVPIDVPPPLQAEFHRWEDAYFRDQRAIDLSAPQPFADLIHNSGTISGKIKNSRPHSTTEAIDLLVEPYGSGPQDPNILRSVDGTNQLEDDGRWQLAISGLRANQQTGDGDNKFTLTAWKPINQVVHGGPEVKEVILTGVLPRVRDIFVSTPGPDVRLADGQLFPNGLTDSENYRIVARRTVTSARFSHGRSLTSGVAVMEIVNTQPDQFHDSLNEPSQPQYYYAQVNETKYDNVTRTTAAFQLPQQADRTYSLMAWASNDYGEITSSELDLNAPMPVIDGLVIEPDGPHLTPFRVGNSTTTAIASFRSRWALSVTVEGTSPVVPPAGSNTGDFRGHNHDLRLPPTGELQAGSLDLPEHPNRFTIQASNEFAAQPISFIVYRRGNVWTTTGNLALREMSEEEDRYLVGTIEWENGSVTSFLTREQIIGGNYTSDHPSLGFSLIRWNSKRMQNGQLINTSFPGELRINTITEGPDYDNWRGVFEVPRDWIDTDYDHRIVGNVSGRLLLIHFVVKETTSERVIPITLHRTF